MIAPILRHAGVLLLVVTGATGSFITPMPALALPRRCAGSVRCAGSHSCTGIRMRMSADAMPELSTDDQVAAITAVGEATAVLPVVSTLVFVFALESLFQSEFVSAVSLADQAVLILLSMAAALSLYTTTFSVLECALPATRTLPRTHLT